MPSEVLFRSFIKTVRRLGVGFGVPVCREDAKASCCAKDEGRPFGAVARETCPAMLMITSSPAPDSAISVTNVWRFPILLERLPGRRIAYLDGLVEVFEVAAPVSHAEMLRHEPEIVCAELHAGTHGQA